MEYPPYPKTQKNLSAINPTIASFTPMIIKSRTKIRVIILLKHLSNHDSSMLTLESPHCTIAILNKLFCISRVLIH